MLTLKNFTVHITQSNIKYIGYLELFLFSWTSFCFLTSLVDHTDAANNTEKSPDTATTQRCQNIYSIISFLATSNADFKYLCPKWQMGIRKIEIFMKYVDFTGKQTKWEIRSREHILNISDILNYNLHLLVNRMHGCNFFLPKY